MPTIDPPHYGIGPEGFVLKEFDIILDEITERYKELFQTDSIDISPSNPMVKISEATALETSNLYQTLEYLYYSRFVHTASLQALEYLAIDMGLDRRPAQKATVDIRFYTDGTSDVDVPAGTEVETDDGILFLTDALITITAPATQGDSPSTADVEGTAGNVLADTLINLPNPPSGVESADNPLAATGGRDIETEDELRARLIVAPRYDWTADAIKSVVDNLEFILNSKVIEAGPPPGYANDTEFTVLVRVSGTFSELQSTIEDTIDSVRPITVDFTVAEATAVPINIIATVTLEDGVAVADIQESVELRIETYLKTLNIDDDVLYSQIANTILDQSEVLNVDLVGGGAMTINAVADDKVIDTDEVAVFNSLTLNTP